MLGTYLACVVGGVHPVGGLSEFLRSHLRSPFFIGFLAPMLPPQNDPNAAPGTLQAGPARISRRGTNLLNIQGPPAQLFVRGAPTAIVLGLATYLFWYL